MKQEKILHEAVVTPPAKQRKNKPLQSSSNIPRKAKTTRQQKLTTQISCDTRQEWSNLKYRNILKH
jgi:hypothetical protein